MLGQLELVSKPASQQEREGGREGGRKGGRDGGGEGQGCTCEGGHIDVHQLSPHPLSSQEHAVAIEIA